MGRVYQRILLGLLLGLFACNRGLPSPTAIPRPTDTPVPPTATPRPSPTVTMTPTALPTSTPTPELRFQGNLSDLLCTQEELPFPAQFLRTYTSNAQDAIAGHPDPDYAQQWVQRTGYQDGQANLFQVKEPKAQDPVAVFCGAERYRDAASVQAAIADPLYAKVNNMKPVDVDVTIGDATTVWQYDLPEQNNVRVFMVLFTRGNVGFGVLTYFRPGEGSPDVGLQIAQAIYENRVAQADFGP